MNLIIIDSIEVVREAFRIGLPLDELIELDCAVCGTNVFVPLELMEAKRDDNLEGICCSDCGEHGFHLYDNAGGLR